MMSIVLGKDGDDLLPGQPLKLSPRYRPPKAPKSVTVDRFDAFDGHLVIHVTNSAQTVDIDEQVVTNFRVYLASASDSHAASGRRPDPSEVLVYGDFDLDPNASADAPQVLSLDVTKTMPGDILEGSSEMSGEVQVAVLTIAKSGAASSSARWSAPFSWPHPPGAFVQTALFEEEVVSHHPGN